MKEEEASLARPGRRGPDVMDGPIKRMTISSQRARGSRMCSRSDMACDSPLSESERNTPYRTDLRGRVPRGSSLAPWVRRVARNSAQEVFDSLRLPERST